MCVLGGVAHLHHLISVSIVVARCSVGVVCVPVAIVNALYFVCVCVCVRACVRVCAGMEVGVTHLGC